ncbi:MAG: RNA 3'-terminal phosphate cyclase [Steroidobacteraceae bacterium]
MIELDGSAGEGGGQILRSALSLSICTARPFRITNIRANRPKPGLMRQHLTAVKAAAAVCSAEISGAEIGSTQLIFQPGRLRAGDYSFAVGTAGSCTLVLQTVLPPLLTASSTSHIRIAGGTHNKGAPPFNFLERAFLPLLRRMGPRVQVELVSYGFYPRGGGEICAHIDPVKTLSPLHVLERGRRIEAYAESYIAAIPIHVAQRELATIGRMLNWLPEQLKLRGLPNDVGPGNVVSITIAHEHVTDVFTAFGEKGVSAEAVAKEAGNEARDYLASSAATGPHLADQLILPMALCGTGSFTTSAATTHLKTNAAVVERFMGCHVDVSSVGELFQVSIRP